MGSREVTSGRDGGDKEFYTKIFNYLIENGFIIYLTGNSLFTTKDLKNFHNRVLNHEMLDVDQNLFNIFAPLNNDLFIGENGGGSWFGCYAKTAIGINWFPPHFKRYNFHILGKKLIEKDNFTNSLEFSKLFDNKSSYEINKNVLVKNNSINEVINFLKVKLK